MQIQDKTPFLFLKHIQQNNQREAVWDSFKLKFFSAQFGGSGSDSVCVSLSAAAGQNPDHVLQGTGVKPEARRPGEDSTIAPEDAARFLSCYCSGHCPEDATNNTCQWVETQEETVNHQRHLRDTLNNFLSLIHYHSLMYVVWLFVFSGPTVSVSRSLKKMSTARPSSPLAAWNMRAHTSSARWKHTYVHMAFLKQNFSETNAYFTHPQRDLSLWNDIHNIPWLLNDGKDENAGIILMRKMLKGEQFVQVEVHVGSPEPHWLRNN